MREVLAAICDDESVALDMISSALVSCFRKYGVNIQLYKFSNPKKFMEHMGDRSYQLVFLDIDMNTVNGIDIGIRLKEMNESAEIIFVSNCEGEVFHAFQARPFGFVRKSSFLKDVESVVKLYVSALEEEKEKDYLVCKTSGGMERIETGEIACIECVKDYQYVRLKKGGEPIRIKDRMFSLEEQLGKSGFLRINKGYLVNYTYIRRILTDEVELLNGETVSISRGKKKDLVLQYMRLCRVGL